MLKVSGVWVSPSEIERALIEHSAVAEVAVVANKGQGWPPQAGRVGRPQGGIYRQCRDGLHSPGICRFPASQLQAATLRGVCFGIAQELYGQDSALQTASGFSRFLISSRRSTRPVISKTCNTSCPVPHNSARGSAGRQGAGFDASIRAMNLK